MCAGALWKNIKKTVVKTRFSNAIVAFVEKSSRRKVWWFARDPLAKGAGQGQLGRWNRDLNGA